MIYGIGTDIVRIARMADNLERYGERFAARVLCDEEMLVYAESAQKASFLSKRFAAKEAAAKALGTGFRDGLSLRDIRVSNDELGKPMLSFTEGLQEKLEQQGVGKAHLSLADEREYAIANVILERQTS